MQELIELIQWGNPVYKSDTFNETFKSALEKEKEQLIKAHIDGFDHIVVDFKKQEYAEQYYNETYNQNES